jgi:hypothetical protein
MRYKNFLFGFLLCISVQPSHSMLQTPDVSYSAKNAGLLADGKTDDSAAINRAIDSAIAGNFGTVQLPCGQIMVNKAIDLTNRANLTVRGCAANLDFGSPYPQNDTQLLCNTGTVCIDMTGSSSMKLENLSLRIANKYPTPSTIGVLMGRDDAAGGGGGVYCYSQFNHFDNLYVFSDTSDKVNSGRGYIGIYDIGAEHLIISRTKITAPTPLFFASTNVLKLRSPYQALATGCPVSMTGVIFNDVSVTPTHGSGIEIWDSGEFLLNFFEVIYGLYTKEFAVALNGHLVWEIKGNVHVERPNAPGNFLSIASKITDHIELHANVGLASGSAPYINLNGNNLTVTNSRVEVRCQTGACQTMFSNGGKANQWRGGEIDLGTTVPPVNAFNLTVVGAVIHADGFKHSQVTFSEASRFLLLDNEGVLVVGNH